MINEQALLLFSLGNVIIVSNDKMKQFVTDTQSKHCHKVNTSP